MDRTVLHCDCNSFFASCETVLDPKLKDVPMAVCGDPENRHGIILAKNELAKKYDVKTAETIWQAQRKCPGLVLVRPHHGLYEEFSAKCSAIYREYTDMVEPFGIDESWLDVTASRRLFGTGREIADTIRERFKRELGLTCSVGVSFNKTMAKLGSDYKKPDATTVIDRENFESIVWPLDVSALLFAGKSACETLAKHYVFTIGELARTPRENVERWLGKLGGQLHDYACGEDDSPVETIYATHTPKSVGSSRTFRRDLISPDDVRAGLLTVAEKTAIRLREAHMKCTVVTLGLRYDDFSQKNRQVSLNYATSLCWDLMQTASELCSALNAPPRPIRLISITGSGLVREDEAFEQLSLLTPEKSEKRQKFEQVESAVDRIRAKYGTAAIGLGGLMDKDIK